MVPGPLSISRRQFLGGLTAATIGGTVAVGATAPSALPDVLTDEATKHYPTPPEVTSHWRPTVTEAHAREAVTLLEETVSEGRRRWQQLDTDEAFHAAGGWLDDARTALRNDTYHEALFDARYGIQFAAEALGIAQARLDRVDFEALVERGSNLLDRTQQVHTDLRPYPVSDSARDVAWYYRIEQAILLGRRNVSLDRIEELQTDRATQNNGDSSSRPQEVGSILAGLLQGQIHVLTAEHYRDRLVETMDDSTTAYAPYLEHTASQLQMAIERFPGRDEAVSEYIDDDDSEVTPYEFAHERLGRWCYDTQYLVAEDNADLRAYSAVELSKGLAQRRAHDFAVEHLVVDRGDRDFDSGHTLAEKRRARSVYQSVVGSNPPPLLTIQVRRAVEELQVAKVGFAGSYQQPIWRERLKAYLYALVGRAKLEQYPIVYDAIADGQNSSVRSSNR
jgi:hypothetical protein